jgi:hypothetical protein
VGCIKGVGWIIARVPAIHDEISFPLVIADTVAAFTFLPKQVFRCDLSISIKSEQRFGQDHYICIGSATKFDVNKVKIVQMRDPVLGCIFLEDSFWCRSTGCIDRRFKDLDASYKSS